MPKSKRSSIVVRGPCIDVMPTTREELAEWFDEGVRHGADFMVIAVDTFDVEDTGDYPVYVYGARDVAAARAHELEHKPMSRVMEIYDLRGDKEAQLAADRTWAVPRPSPGETTRSVEDFLRRISKGDA